MATKSSTKIHATRCYVCGKECFNKDNLKVHSRIHTGEKPLQCSHCGKSFRHHSSLAVHEITHSGEKPFNCQFCDKKFISSTAKRTHERRVHSDGEKPYHCVICWKTFADFAYLKAHNNRVHLKIRPFKCHICGKAFYSKQKLEVRHAKTHCGRKAVLAVEPPSKISSSDDEITINPLKLKECTIRLQKLAYIEEALELGCTTIWIPSIGSDLNINKPKLLCEPLYRVSYHISSN